MDFRNPHGCGHSCVLGSPGGMAPNGACHCLSGVRQKLGQDKYREVFLGIQALRDEITSLEKEVEGLYENM